jgi:hypothetical protein
MSKLDRQALEVGILDADCGCRVTNDDGRLVTRMTNLVPHLPRASAGQAADTGAHQVGLRCRQDRLVCSLRRLTDHEPIASPVGPSCRNCSAW